MLSSGAGGGVYAAPGIASTADKVGRFAHHDTADLAPPGRMTPSGAEAGARSYPPEQDAHSGDADKEKPPDVSVGGFCWDPGSDLLSPGLRPNYHRRRAFSLPSSEWDRVVPARYDRQENCRPRR